MYVLSDNAVAYPTFTILAGLFLELVPVTLATDPVVTLVTMLSAWVLLLTRLTADTVTMDNESPPPTVVVLDAAVTPPTPSVVLSSFCGFPFDSSRETSVALGTLLEVVGAVVRWDVVSAVAAAAFNTAATVSIFFLVARPVLALATLLLLLLLSVAFAPLCGGFGSVLPLALLVVALLELMPIIGVSCCLAEPLLSDGVLVLMVFDEDVIDGLLALPLVRLLPVKLPLLCWVGDEA